MTMKTLVMIKTKILRERQSIIIFFKHKVDDNEDASVDENQNPRSMKVQISGEKKSARWLFEPDLWNTPE